MPLGTTLAMPLRNGSHGYGTVTRSLHWATVLVLAAQFALGYTMDVDDGGHGRGRGRGGESGRGRGRGGDDDGLDGLPDTRILAGRSLTVPWACELPKSETFLQVEVSPDYDSEEAIFTGDVKK